MSSEKVAKYIGWVVLVGALVGAVGSFRYFRTPPELRFVTTEAVWVALPFLGLALLAGLLLLLLRAPRVKQRDE